MALMDVVTNAIQYIKNAIYGGHEQNNPVIVILGYCTADGLWHWGHWYVDDDGNFKIESEGDLELNSGGVIKLNGNTPITSEPGSGEYRIKELRLDASKHIVVTYDEDAEA